MAIGTNIGLSKMAECTKGFDYHKLANISQWRLQQGRIKARNMKTEILWIFFGIHTAKLKEKWHME